MIRLSSAAIVMVLALNIGNHVLGDDAKAAAEILDKAINALGGEEKLSKAKVIQWKVEGVLDIPNQVLHFTVHYTTQGLDHARIVHEFRVGGLRDSGVVLLAGERGWSNFDKNQPIFPWPWRARPRVWRSFKSSESRIYLNIIPITVLPLKGRGFKVVAIGDGEVSGKPAAGVKVTGPDGKDFTLYFDKETGLPAKQVFDHVETIFGDYKEVGGIKKAMHIETKGPGVPFQEAQIIDFKILDKVDPQMFAEPQ